MNRLFAGQTHTKLAIALLFTTAAHNFGGTFHQTLRSRISIKSALGVKFKETTGNFKTQKMVRGLLQRTDDPLTIQFNGSEENILLITAQYINSNGNRVTTQVPYQLSESHGDFEFKSNVSANNIAYTLDSLIIIFP